ncbi:MAG: DUF2889 domain-containing protein [Acidimicrobiales bacterium]
MATSIHQRSYDCEAFDEGNGRMRVRGRLVDNKPHGLGLADGEPLVIHDMEVDLIVSIPAFVIEAVEARMNVHPYRSCPEILVDYQRLVGLSITRGYSRRVRELFGGPGGCSHVGALLQALGPVAVQASWSLTTLHDDPADRLATEGDADSRDRRLQMNANTCHVWAEDGEQVQQLRAGGDFEPPIWATERMVELGLKPDAWRQRMQG